MHTVFRKTAYWNRTIEEQWITVLRKEISYKMDWVSKELRRINGELKLLDSKVIWEILDIKSLIVDLGIDINQPGNWLNRRFNECIICYNREIKQILEVVLCWNLFWEDLESFGENYSLVNWTLIFQC